MSLPKDENPNNYLFITEVGSRMWGMEDLSSDHDLFFCYQTPASEYLRTGNFHPNRPMRSMKEGDEEYDCQYMEIGHLVNLLMKGNVNAIWAVCSPIVHHTSPTLERLKILTLSQLSQASYNSIKGMAISQRSDVVKRASVKLPEKSMKTCIRTLWFGCAMMQGAGIDFSPVESATDQMCRDEFERFEHSYQTARIRKEPDRQLFERFLIDTRLIELERHIITRVGL